jgi:hypothetical protein
MSRKFKLHTHIVVFALTFTSLFTLQNIGLSARAAYSCTPTLTGTLTDTVTTLGNDCIIIFTGGTGSWTAPSNISSVQYLVVGGGGAGGFHGGGGGGAGGFATSTAFAVSPTSTYTVTVGTGGAASSSGAPTTANSGTNSQFASVIGYGGGAGGSYVSLGNGNIGLNGGSGGGGSTGSTVASTATQNLVGGIGGYGGPAAGTQTWNPGSGGGGASSAGVAATNNQGGNGGSGASSAITGTLTCYATGGGGGISDSTSSPSGYKAGVGGSCPGMSQIAPNGGNGTVASFVPAAPLANSGAGGGGAGYDWSLSNQSSAPGASGIVVLRYTPTYTITYNINGGTGGSLLRSTDSYYLLNPAAISLPAMGSGVTNSTYAFSGWCDVFVGSGSSCSDTPLFVNSNFTPTSSLTLYAIWISSYSTTATVSVAAISGGIQFGKTVQLQATVTWSQGVISFFVNGKKAFRCVNLATSNFVASCTWKPDLHGTVVISAVFIPNDGAATASVGYKYAVNLPKRTLARG